MTIAFQVEGETVDEVVGKLVDLASRLQGGSVEDVSPTVGESSTAPKGRGRPKKETKTEEATSTAPATSVNGNASPSVVSTVVDPFDDVMGGGTPTPPPMTADEFKQKCQALVQTVGVETIKKHLATFGVMKIGELKPEQYQNFLSLFK